MGRRPNDRGNDKASSGMFPLASHFSRMCNWTASRKVDPPKFSMYFDIGCAFGANKHSDPPDSKGPVHFLENGQNASIFGHLVGVNRVCFAGCCSIVQSFEKTEFFFAFSIKANIGGQGGTPGPIRELN